MLKGLYYPSVLIGVDYMLEILNGLFTIGWSIITIIFNLIIALTIGVTMQVKGRNGFFWGILGFFFPILILFVYFIPRKVPKLDRAIRNHPDFVGHNPAIASIMALSAIIAKADGRIKKQEIQLIRRFVQQQFGLNTTAINEYEGIFNYGKNNPDSYQYFTEYLRGYGRYNTKLAVSYLFVGIAMQDGEISRQEELLLNRIIGGIGLNTYVYQSIKAHYMGMNGYSGSSYQRSSFQSGMSQQSQIKKYSDVLGVDEKADMPTIKKAYRKLAKENHPDTLAQAGMPEDYIEFANKRIAEINEAYDYLKDVKAA